MTVSLGHSFKEHAQFLVVVEDNQDDEVLTLRAVRQSGVNCSVSVIRHGREALNQLVVPEGEVPDLIVLDFHLPGYNGLEILRALRKEDRTKRVPIVMLSALESSREIRQCLDEWANSFVRKPVDFAQYMEQVKLVIRYWLTADQRPEYRRFLGE
jgi:two-component system response regulator